MKPVAFLFPVFGLIRASLPTHPASEACRNPAVAPSLKVEISPVNVTDAGEIERDVADFARGANGGLIVASSQLAAFHRDLIVTLGARHRLPATT